MENKYAVVNTTISEVYYSQSNQTTPKIIMSNGVQVDIPNKLEASLLNFLLNAH